jgi:hypothetical protein
MTESSKPSIGQAVVFVDAQGKRHDALLLAVHGDTAHAAVNLVYVTKNPDKRDPYGQQTERCSSVVHQLNQAAHGMYWELGKA